MNTVDELVNYCCDLEPVGALLLTGEWGCGKTYIIENEFKQAIADKAIVLRISLFGISSTDEIHSVIKRTWIAACLEAKGINKAWNTISQIKEQAEKLDFLPSWLRNIASLEVKDFITIRKEIDEKTVVLVFDDLERCQMSSTDILGVINEYCENKKFHTIIVANQEKIISRQAHEKMTGEILFLSSENHQDTNNERKVAFSLDQFSQGASEEISYIEIKEKIIQRTVQYLPDYAKIVSVVIDEVTKNRDEEYKSFIKSCEDGLLDLFAPDRDEASVYQNKKSDILSNKNTVQHRRPHNIRSLKCAISDFYRVYKVLQENKIDDLEKRFYSFTAYVISYKAGIAEEGNYGTILTDDVVSQLYPAYQNSYMLATVKEWILRGSWNENALAREIEMIKERRAAQRPCEFIRTNRIMDIDEDTINQGFAEFLGDIYAGHLSLDDYVLFIENSSWARKCEYVFPLAVDWNEVQNGVGRCIERYKKALPDGQILFRIIEEDSKMYFTDAEWKVYKLISDFALGNGMMFLKNRKLYIEKISENASAAFITVQNKRFDVFDEEMAIITAQAFANESNYGKRIFVSSFSNMWKLNVQSDDLRINDSLKGFEKLRALLTEQHNECQTQNKTLAAFHTLSFIQSVDDIIDMCNQRID